MTDKPSPSLAAQQPTEYIDLEQVANAMLAVRREAAQRYQALPTEASRDEFMRRLCDAFAPPRDPCAF